MTKPERPICSALYAFFKLHFHNLFSLVKRQFKLFLTIIALGAVSQIIGQSVALTYEDYIRSGIASKEEIDVFLHEPSWAQFDAELGYILGNYSPHDGWNNSRTISTVRKDGARTSSVYSDRSCRINTYGNSFTQCHQVNDAETWQEYLAGHLGEPVRNYGMGGYGVYQAYRRMLREEQTENKAEYIILYIWGDDHIRSLLRCRYALIGDWNNKTNQLEGEGIMFHGNFWANIEMNLETGMLEEHDSRIQSRDELYQMTEPDWMLENLKDDLALQLYLYKQGKISGIDLEAMKLLAGHLDVEFNQDAEDLPKEAEKLLDSYAYTSTMYILQQSRAFAEENGKKLMVILFDPYKAMKQLLLGESRVDQLIVDFLDDNNFNYFDMNQVHAEDYNLFKPDIEGYYNRYFIGHYSPAGNHFFAYSLAPKVIQWLDPKPLPYLIEETNFIDFNGYLDGGTLKNEEGKRKSQH